MKSNLLGVIIQLFLPASREGSRAVAVGAGGGGRAAAVLLAAAGRVALQVLVLALGEARVLK